MTIAMSVKKSLAREIEVSCSQFMRFFLAHDSKLLEHKLNRHINNIVQLYLAGKLDLKDEPKIGRDWLALIQPNANDWHIRVDLNQSIYEKLKHCDIFSMRRLIESAINAYILFSLEKSERSKVLWDVARQCRREIAKLDKRLSMFDEEDHTLHETKSGF